MAKNVDVNTGEVVVSSENLILRSIAIGSCIVIAAYDPRKKIAGMAHIMLAGRAPENGLERTKYAEDAIEEMIAEMTRQGCDLNDIEACLVGAGNVLEKDDDTICEENIRSVTNVLSEMNIPVRASVVGGTKRKGVYLDVATGEVLYTEADSSQMPLWQPEHVISGDNI